MKRRYHYGDHILVPLTVSFLLIADVAISSVNETTEDGLDNCVVDEADVVDIAIDVFPSSLLSQVTPRYPPWQKPVYKKKIAWLFFVPIKKVLKNVDITEKSINITCNNINNNISI